tara:strand:- start:1028 stop:1567 length:540 start_codon:yes stop_codon:yes gene_type:complete
MNEITLPRRDYLEEIEEEALEKFLEMAAPHIGRIVMEFNSLEAYVDFCSKEILSSSEVNDDLVYVYLTEMMYSSKVAALMNLYGQINEYCNLELSEKLLELEKSLRESAKRRNQYAHGNWYGFAEGYVHVHTKAKRNGVYSVYRKFDEETMKSDLEFIENTMVELDEFNEKFNEKLHYQ